MMKTTPNLTTPGLAALGALLLIAPAQAQDATTGAQIVQSECAGCHAVGGEAKSPEAKAPRFADVAALPSTTELSLKVFLRSSHKNMPNILLEPDEIDAVSAYILGLKKKR
jgi:mono/diheme cytochrome c family protein